MNRLLFPALALAALTVAGCGSAPAASTDTQASASATAGAGARGAGRNGAAGELVSIKDGVLILNSTAGDVTVKYDPAALTVTRTSTGTVADIVVGVCLTGQGQKDGSGVITASAVLINRKVNGTCAGPNRVRPSGAPTPSGTPRTANPNGAGGGFLRGEVTAVAGTQVTVQPTSGAAQVLTVPTTVKVARTDTAAVTDLAIGDCVAAQGPRDSSGVVTARTLAIQPAGPTGCFTGGGRGFGGFGGGRGNGGATGGGVGPGGTGGGPGGAAPVD